MSFCRAALWLACLTLLGGICGCGESDPLGRHAISGSVNVNGAPLENGNIGFQPADTGATSSGAVIAAGKYSIPRQKGLAAGKYRVTVNAPVPGTGGTAPAMPGDAVPPPQELIADEWNTKSEQFIEVKDAGPFVFDFNVKAKGK
jgi:hypothetical protein